MQRKLLFLFLLPAFLLFLPFALFLTDSFDRPSAVGKIFPEDGDRTPIQVSPKGNTEAFLLLNRNPFQIVLSRLAEKRPVARTLQRRPDDVPVFFSLLSFSFSGVPVRGHHAAYYSYPVVYHQTNRTRPVRAGPLSA